MIDKAGDEQRWSRLMAAAHRGDKHAYDELLRELAIAIERYVRRQFGALSFVEDCVQECLLAVHKGRHTYDPRRPFRPWLFTIVRNRVIDLLRGAYAGAYVPDTYFDSGRISPDPSEEFAAGEVLAQLDSRQRAALTLTKIHGYSLAEAAERCGVSETAMKSRVSRALRAASQLLRVDR